MPVQFDKFDQPKVDRLKFHLETQAEKGPAKFYEIYVDNLKAVPKTDSPQDFDGYENYLNSDSSELKIIIYNTGSSPRNDQYVFSLKAKNPQEALENGLDGFALKGLTKNELFELKVQRDAKVAESLEVIKLKKDIEDLSSQLQENKEYTEKLENGLEIARANGNKIGGVNIGDAISDALEGLVRRNTHIIAQLPGLDGIAKVIEKDNANQQNRKAPQPDAEVTFKKKTEQSETPELTAQEKQFLDLFKQIQKHFSEDDLTRVIEILDRLSLDKAKILPVLELLQEEGNQS